MFLFVDSPPGYSIKHKSSTFYEKIIVLKQKMHALSFNISMLVTTSYYKCAIYNDNVFFSSDKT